MQIQQAVPHFCKGDIFQENMILPVGESSCDIIELQTMKVLESIKNDHAKNGNLTSIKLSEKHLFLGFESGLLKLYETETFQCLKETNLTHSVNCIDCDENYVVTGNPENFILSLEIPMLKLAKKRELPSKGISSLMIRKDGKILAGGSWDGTLRVFSWLKPNNLKPLGALKFHEKPVESVATSSRKPFLFAAGSVDTYVTVWNIYNS